MNFSLCNTNTDKFSGGLTEKNTDGHNYQLLYKNFVNSNAKTILEVGTGNGGFAKFIRENNLICHLVGADIAPNKQHRHVSDTSNYNYLYDSFYHGDCFSTFFLNWLTEKNYKFNLIIEDAEHTFEQQRFMLEHGTKFLEKNGVYISEDIQSYHIAKELMKYVPKELKKFSYIWEGSDSIGRYDDICIVIDTRENVA